MSASADSLAAVSHTKWTTQTLSISADGTEGVRKRPKPGWPGTRWSIMAPSCRRRESSSCSCCPRKTAPASLKDFFGGKKPPPRSGRSARGGFCVAEIANIVVNAITNALADACGESFILSAPTMILGTKEALLKLAVDELEAGGQTFAIMTYVSMSSEKLSSDCTVLLLLSPACRGRILKALDQDVEVLLNRVEWRSSP